MSAKFGLDDFVLLTKYIISEEIGLLQPVKFN